MPPIANEYLDNEHPINAEWGHYYVVLEGIRKSGICNMWGASPYLAELCKISAELASKVLCSWIKNYDAIKAKYFPSDQTVYVDLSDLCNN